MMSQNGSRLLRLVNQLLALSKLDQGKLKLELEYCDVNELVRLVVSNFDSAAKIKHIDLKFYGNEDPVKNEIDKEKIRQVLYNLINNAIKFTPEGGNVRVSLIANNGLETSKQRSDGTIDITVKDSEIGIPDHELNNISDRFYQVNNPNQDESEGTGIGLALAQKLVHLHNGTIEVESELGWGTKFSVTLPMVKAQKKAPTVAKSLKETDASYTIEPGTSVADEPVTYVTARAESDHHNYPVLLIVEDNAQMRQYIKSCLGDNYNYLEASNGVEGLKAAN